MDFKSITKVFTVLKLLFLSQWKQRRQKADRHMCSGRSHTILCQRLKLTACVGRYNKKALCYPNDNILITLYYKKMQANLQLIIAILWNLREDQLVLETKPYVVTTDLPISFSERTGKNANSALLQEAVSHSRVGSSIIQNSCMYFVVFLCL